MLTDIVTPLGGVGLFLLGMIILTEGLRDLSGNAIRSFLARHTDTPAQGALSGALSTALIQSSSATTVMAVGFVGAGLMTFPQGLGIVFGANIGTTITGWFVAILGFKLKIGALALPMVFVGALLRLFAPGKWRHVGRVMAGFGLLFVGIGMMQNGMAPFQGAITPADFPDDTLFGRLQLVALGILITLITQSSSAGVATALVALSTGAISLPQAAAMVIGMDVGTTSTAMIATIGGSTAMRQTGWAHVLYNGMTGLLAFILLEPFSWAWAAWTAHGGGDVQLALVAFHTTFNLFGVFLILPMARPFGRLIERLIPERGSPVPDRLDRRLLRDPRAAIDAAAASVGDVARLLSTGVHRHLSAKTATAYQSGQIAQAIDRVRGYLAQIRTDSADAVSHSRHQSVLHALDHCQRLMQRLGETERLQTATATPGLRRLAGLLAGSGARAADTASDPTLERHLDRLCKVLRRRRHRFRAKTVRDAAKQVIDPDATLRRMDAARWLHRVGYHMWRIQHHLSDLDPRAAAAEAADAELRAEAEDDA